MSGTCAPPGNALERVGDPDGTQLLVQFADRLSGAWEISDAALKSDPSTAFEPSSCASGAPW